MQHNVTFCGEGGGLVLRCRKAPSLSLNPKSPKLKNLNPPAPNACKLYTAKATKSKSKEQDQTSLKTPDMNSGQFLYTLSPLGFRGLGFRVQV